MSAIKACSHAPGLFWVFPLWLSHFDKKCEHLQNVQGQISEAKISLPLFFHDSYALNWSISYVGRLAVFKTVNM